MFASRGTVETVVVTSLAFAVAHAVTALSPDQSTSATLRTIGFAFLFGVVASMLVRITGSIWPAVVLHATIDLAGFVLTPRSALVTDGISIVLAAVVALALILIARRTPLPAYYRQLLPDQPRDEGAGHHTLFPE